MSRPGTSDSPPQIGILEKIRNLGNTGETVNVKDGYGRNFLLKTGKALRADKKNIEFLNSTSTKLPFVDNSVDRVLALESAQHFKPLGDFIAESKRVLIPSGFLVMAVPITVSDASLGKLGLLKFTWSSEHYSLDYLKNLLTSNGFKIIDEKLIGSNVYDPLADYYVENRKTLSNNILEHYPGYMEKILYKSLLKMKKASQEKIIDYVLLKCILNNKSK